MKKYLFFLPLLFVLLSLCSCGKKSAAPRTVVELRGPSGLTCEISGLKAPLKFRLAPGSYVMAFSAPGYRSDFQKVTVPRGKKFVYDVKLSPVRTSVLVNSTPSGARVTLKGRSMGITPLVIRDLERGDYTLQLSMQGYASVPLNFKISSERPVFASARLDSNQGVLIVTSTPSRARVFVNGTEVGETPYRMEREEGKYTLRLERAGCNPEERSVSIRKRSTDKCHVRLGEKPGAISITSTPAGAEVFVENLKRGVTPCTVEALAPGKYTLRLTKKGFDPVESQVTVAAGTTDIKKYVLSSSTGSVIFNVRPAGVEVFLNGRSLGITRSVTADSEATRDFKVENLPPGKHEIAMFHSLGIPNRQTVSFQIRKNKSITLKNIVMWIANCEITYYNNSKERGYLHDSQPAYVVFSPEPGVRFRLERSRIKGLIMLSEKKK